MLKRLCRERALHLMLLPIDRAAVPVPLHPAGRHCDRVPGLFAGAGHSALDWVGLGNFTYIFSLPTFPRVLRNTLIACGKVVLNILVPVTFALLLNEIRSAVFKRTIQTVAYLPHFLSWVILGGILTDVLSPSTASSTAFSALFGMEPVFFLGDAAIFPIR